MASQKFLYFLMVLLNVFQTPLAANILGLFPHHGYSHFKVYYPLLNGLAERGHQITVVTYINATNPHPNYKELLLTGFQTVNACDIDDFTITRSLPILFYEYWGLHQEGQESCENFYKSGYPQKIFKRHKEKPYDLVIVENFNTDCYMAIPYVLETPIVGFSSCLLMPWYYDRILLPDIPSYVQSEFIGFAEELNWYERLVNFIQAKSLKLLYRFYTNHMDNKMVNKYLNISMDVTDFSVKATNFIFVNQHYSLTGNRPLTRQLIEIGGIHINTQNKQTLPNDIQKFVNESTDDILYISWGSMIRGSSLDPEKLKDMIAVLETQQLNIIWKWESDVTPTNNSKFFFVKWAPQLELLCHPRIKYFWGHAGLLGLTEAVYCGKPAILTPIYGDQFVNAHAMENRGSGVVLHYYDISKERVQQSVEEIKQKRYTENALSLSNIFRNRENTPLSTAIWWIEHLAEHGTRATELLQTKAVNMNWFEYNSLDSIGILLVPFIIPIMIVYYLCRSKRDENKRKIE